LRTAEPDLDEISTILNDIIAADKRAGDLIWKLRSFVRREPTKPVPVDINAVINGVVEILNSDMVIRGVTLRTALTATPATVMGDQVQLQQVLVNLITNAEQAVGDLPESRREIEVRSSEVLGDVVAVEIRDWGPGIDVTGSDIFEPFFTTKSDGMGMGLSICRSLIESHGGLIWAENAPDGGARVCFTLPAAGGPHNNNESERGRPPRV
jgi:C4-dicarboxylate-specific signal transduction histidine kinase